MSTAAERCIDAVGVAHRKAGRDARIVSLVPSLTELLCELGLEAQIVGRTGFCIHPRDIVRHIPKVGGTKDVDVARIRELAPTHVIVNIDENRREVVDELAGFVDDIFVTHPLAPEDNLGLFEAMGFLFSRERRAATLAARLRGALNRIHAVADRPRATVLYLIWRDPWMTISPDTYIARMLKLVNWDTLPAAPPTRYPEIALADFVGSVERVLLSSEPYPFRDKHVVEIKALFGDRTEVSLVDGEMLSWYGSRAIAGIDYLGALAARTCGESIA
jgi:ABC-type Fe3+-hydroxamate transport system substrate-binding protein